MTNEEHLSAMREEATATFVGMNEVVGVAQSGDAELTVFLAARNAATERRVRVWAAPRRISVSFIVSGRFGAA